MDLLTSGLLEIQYKRDDLTFLGNENAVLGYASLLSLNSNRVKAFPVMGLRILESWFIPWLWDSCKRHPTGDLDT